MGKYRKDIKGGNEKEKNREREYRIFAK